MYKRYLVFAHDQYYPGGGLSDVEFETDNLIIACEKCDRFSKCFDNVYVFDCISRKIIYELKE